MKNKFIHYGALALTGLMLFSACKKEDDSSITDPAFILYAEGYGSDSKMEIDGKYVIWVTGDGIRINDRVSNVVVRDGNPYIQSAHNYTVPYYCVSPSSLYNSQITGPDITVNLPNSYTYDAVNGKQNLSVPMCAYAEVGNALEFKHLTGSLIIRIENNFGTIIKVNRIEVSSNKYKLCGSRDITISDNPSISPEIAGSDSEKKVTMLFEYNGSPSLTIPCDSAVYVMIPVLPVDSDNKFTIEIKVKAFNGTSNTYTFTKTQNGGGSLVRAHVAYAPAAYGGVFSVASDRKVSFSPGNLQYQASTGAWKFAERQYMVIGGSTDGGNITSSEATRATQAKWIDLFGWATSGWNGGTWTNYQPWTINTTNNQYGPAYSADFSSTYQNCDWGWYNAISNSDNAINKWRTLTGDEWFYLIHTRTHGYAKGTVDGKSGLIVFCDGYVHPSGLTPVVYPPMRSTSDGATYNDNVFSYSDFMKMEIAGAIFLPVSNLRRSAVLGNVSNDVNAKEGHYWSSTPSSAPGAQGFFFDDDKTGTGSKGFERRFGLSVRLVHDAN